MGASQKPVTGSLVKRVSADGGRVRQSARGTTSVAKKTVENGTPPKKGKKSGAKTGASKPPANEASATKTGAKKTGAKKTGVKKAVAKKATGVRKAVAKKSAGKSGTGSAKKTPASKPSTVRALKQDLS